MMPSMRTQSNIYERATCIVWSAAYMEEGTGSYYLSLKWIVYFLSTWLNNLLVQTCNFENMFKTEMGCFLESSSESYLFSDHLLSVCVQTYSSTLWNALMSNTSAVSCHYSQASPLSWTSLKSLRSWLYSVTLLCESRSEVGVSVYLESTGAFYWAQSDQDKRREGLQFPGTPLRTRGTLLFCFISPFHGILWVCAGTSSKATPHGFGVSRGICLTPLPAALLKDKRVKLSSPTFNEHDPKCMKFDSPGLRRRASR